MKIWKLTGSPLPRFLTSDDIALGLELKADAILLDDSAAIKEARRLGLPTLRTFAILERAAEMNLLDLPHAIEKISRTSFHLPPNEIIEAMIERETPKGKSKINRETKLRKLKIMKEVLLLLTLFNFFPVQPSQGRPIMPNDSSFTLSYRAPSDFALTADPNTAAWKETTAVVAEKGRRGEVIPGHRTEIRSRWTEKNLYFLFVCPYEELNLKPNPQTTAETNKLWEWDVAEVFIGTDFQNIKRYTEFQVSPQGEWVDLMIDRNPQPATHDWQWSSGFEVKARLDREKKVWCGEMRIPFAKIVKIDNRPPQAGLEMRINFYRIQGPASNRKLINWQPVHNDYFHTPEAFGRLRLQ